MEELIVYAWNVGFAEIQQALSLLIFTIFHQMQNRPARVLNFHMTLGF